MNVQSAPSYYIIGIINNKPFMNNTKYLIVLWDTCIFMLIMSILDQ